MSKLFSSMLQRSCIAAAVISLSACATTTGDYNTVGETLEKTRAAGARAWQGTKDLFGGGTSHSGDELLDEVDLALMEEDALPASATQLSEEDALLANSAQANQSLEDSGLEEPVLAAATLPDAAQQDPEPKVMSTDPAGEPSQPAIAANDHVHDVQKSETLWDIAKLTTGDANNWHVLADVNNLAPNASVFPGQQLSIPADLVKPEFLPEQDSPDSQTPIQTAAVSESNEDGQPEIVITDDAPASVVAAENDASADNELIVNDIASSESEPADIDTTAVMAEAKAFTVGERETLWDFAKRTTGDATNWQIIADQNAFTKKQATLVRAGQTILVPTDLVKEREPEAAAAATETATNSADAVASEEPASSDLVTTESTNDLEPVETDTPTELAETGSEATENIKDEMTAAIDEIKDSQAPLAKTDTSNDSLADTVDTTLASAEEPESESDPIKIVEARYQQNKVDKLVTEDQLAAEAKQHLDSESMAEQSVMVSGTYYPKAVYNDADFSSSLLMRVSPGTELQVSRALGPWFEVQTNKGVGYVHSRDIK